MTNHVITGKQIQAIFIMFWMGSLVVMGINQEAKQDSWISILFSCLMFLPLMALYVRVIYLYPGLNLFEIIFKIFGNIFGRILSIVLLLFAIHLGSMVTSLFTQFIRVENMRETPEILTASFIIILSIWSVKNGPESIGRLSKFTCIVLVVSLSFTFLIAMKDMHFSNLKPVMVADFKSLLSGGFNYCMLSFGEVLLCLCFFSAVSTKAVPTKIFIKSLAATAALLLLATLRNILVLGIPNCLLLTYPSYQCVSVISVGDFFTHIEVLIGINLLVTGFIKICVCLHSASLGLAKVLNITDQKNLAAPCGLIIMTLSLLLYSSSQEQVEWLKVFKIYAIPFEVIFPLVIWLGAEIQTKIKAASSSTKNAIEN